GGKIGWTVAAQATYVGMARRHGVTLIVTLLHCTAQQEITAGEQLLNWGFAMDGKVRPVGELVPPLPAVTASHKKLAPPRPAAPARPGDPARGRADHGRRRHHHRGARRRLAGPPAPPLRRHGVRPRGARESGPPASRLTGRPPMPERLARARALPVDGRHDPGAIRGPLRHHPHHPPHPPPLRAARPSHRSQFNEITDAGRACPGRPGRRGMRWRNYLARRKPMRSRTVAMVAPATSRARAAPCASSRSSCSSSASIFSVRSLIGPNALTTTSARSFLNVPYPAPR